MAYVSFDQASAIIEMQGRNLEWTTNAISGQAALEKASMRIELIPFKIDEKATRPRYKDSRVAAANGDPIEDQPMPFDLVLATIELAIFFFNDPLAEFATHVDDYNASSNLSRATANLPIAVQSALRPHMNTQILEPRVQKEVVAQEKPARQPATAIGFD